MTPKECYHYAIANGRLSPEHEAVIARNAYYAYYYAYFVAGRFRLGESTIARDAELAYKYALHVLKGRFFEAEPVIRQEPIYHWLYQNQITILEKKKQEKEQNLKLNWAKLGF